MSQTRLLVALTATLLATTAGVGAAETFNRVASFPVALNNAEADVTSSEIITATDDGMVLIYSDSPAGGIGFVDITDAKAPKAGGPVIKTLIESFRYPRRGPGMMWEAAAAKVQAQGGRVLLDRGVDSLSYDAGTGIWTVAARSADGSRETFTARNVISSAPVRELVDSIRPRPLSTFNARSLKYRDFLTVALIAKSQKNFPDNWIYIHDPSVQVGRVQNFRSWSPEMVPDDDHTCLGLEYFCFEGDGLWTASDEDLVALAKREIGQIGLIDPADVVDACVVRQPKAYPVYDADYAGHVVTVRRELERDFPSLHLVGRHGMHKYNNQDHAMMTAMLTVENILCGRRRHDVWQVNEDAEYTESGVSGAQAALSSERLVPRKVA